MYFTINTCKTLNIQNNKMFVKSTILEKFIIYNFLREEAHAKRVIPQTSDLRTYLSTVRPSACVGQTTTLNNIYLNSDYV